MPPTQLSDRQQSFMTPHGTAPVLGAAVRGGPQTAPEPVASPRAAVDAALNAAESATTSSNSVSLRFQVGDADLSLHVELRNGEVHTTFRTDSADLRSDLADAWQSSAPGAGSPGITLASPVITSATTLDAGAGEGGHARRDARGSEGTQDSGLSQASLSRGTSSESPSVTDPTPSRPVHARGSAHLLTFA